MALEPEPFCFLETTDETVDYFTNHLYTGKSAERLAKLSRPADLRGDHRRSGASSASVFDICHQAVVYEDISASLQKLVDAGIPIFKLQEAAAMRVPNVTQKIVDTLKRYAKTIYLTQTVEKKDGKLNRFLNLEDAFKAWETNPGPREWRTHFHVPVFLDDLGEFGTTRFAIEDALKFHKAKPLSRQLEIETYTWDVLPDHLKTGDIVDYVCREIEWVRGQLRNITAIARVCHEGRIHRDRPHGSAPWSAALLDAKHDVGVYNRTPEKAKPLADAGAKVLCSIAEAAHYGDVVYTMLADDDALEDVVFRTAVCSRRCRKAASMSAPAPTASR